MANMEIEVVVAEPARLGECPVWSHSEQALYWVDIDGRRVHRLDPSTGTDESCALSGRPGSIALTMAPKILLAAIEHELVWLDWATGRTAPFVALETAGVGIRLNDGRTDPAGRFIVGSMYEDTSAGRFVGSLHQVDADGATRLLRTGVGTANGLGFDRERDLMYFADTPTRQVIAWHYDLDSGGQTGERVFFDYGDIPGKPDGACVDADGCYWSAATRGSALLRITPAGRLDRRIELPVERPTMPAFGGAGLDTLFVTSLDPGRPDDPAGTSSSSSSSTGVAPGSLLAIDLAGTGIRGHLDQPFAGEPPSFAG